MSSIHVLDQNTINQIAAGEVIERPSSVVKELVENSLDAGATAVTVEIQEGGISLIRVTDNGCGIPPGEISTAFLRHSTSKIHCAEDLLTVSSLGFRGEALSSIAAVAQVELLTRTPENLTGIRLRIEGGEELGREEVGTPEGTTFLVRNLFYNTPARRKFLKNPSSEGNAIATLMEHLALSHPKVSFRFLSGGQSRLHTTGSGKLKDIIYTIYGRDITRNLLEIKSSSSAAAVQGYIGKPEINRGNRTCEIYFVNGRTVRSSLITKAIENAYHGYTMQHRYPFTVFFLTVDSALLDVNVHPAKMELRFADEEAVYQAVYDAVRGTLTGEELIPSYTFEERTDRKKTADSAPASEARGPEPFETRRRQRESDTGKNSAHEPSTIERMQQNVRNSLRGNRQFREQTSPSVPALPAQPAPQEVRETSSSPEPAPKQLDLFEEKILSPRTRTEFRLIGQLFDTYWLVQVRDQFLILDQHAAHEKVMYEKILASLKDHSYTSQQVDPPIILTLSDREAEVVTENLPHFEKIGFRIEPFGGREYAVRAVPDNLPGISRSDLLMEMIDTLADDTGHSPLMLVDEKIASMACRAAVKGNSRLSFEEAEALIDELLQLKNPYLCPHGRPTMITMTRYEIEKKFGRVVS